MEYFLILGIKYKKYKKPADIHVHIGDRCIDSFTLDKDYTHVENMSMHVETCWLEKYDKVKWIDKIYGPGTMPVGEEMPKFFKVYTLDSRSLEGKIKIEVRNSNNDWTNGFMKNTSLIKFSIVALLPKPFTYDKCKKLIQTLVRLNKSNDKFVFPMDENLETKGLWRGNTWPSAESFYVKYTNDKRNSDKISDQSMWLGGSFSAEFVIRKKHKVKYIGSMRKDKDIGVLNVYNPETLTLATCKPLLNIYNEDKRSNNT